MRTCNCCGELKPLSSYGRNKGMPDGLLKVCKACMNAKQTARAKTDHGRALSRKNGKAYRKRNAQKISEREKERRRREPERVRRIARESAARRHAADPQRFRERTRKWAKENPTRRRAQRQLNRAVEVGEVIPPKQCSLCKGVPGRGRDGRRLIQAHHPDYSRPLDVEWLCPPCHKAADAAS